MHMYVWGAALTRQNWRCWLLQLLLYICIHTSMTRVNRATFVLLQLSRICTYACIYVSLYVYMYPYLNDKSQPRHFCLVTAASHMHICMYLRMYVCIYVSISQWQESAAPLLSCYSCLSHAHRHVIYPWQESTAPLLSCYSCLSYAHIHVFTYTAHRGWYLG